MILNYSVPQLEFLIGTFDASAYLESISLSVPIHEPGQALLWSGRFKVSNNLAAKIAGLTDDDFSEVETPTRWRPYQQIVRLNLKGYQSPAFRISNYRYDANNLTGEGTLTQLPTAVAGNRTSKILYKAARLRVSDTSSEGLYVSDAIALLLKEAFRYASVYPNSSIQTDTALIYGGLSSSDPWADACKLSGLLWRWLTVDVDEDVVSIGYNKTTLFTRTLKQIELVPDLDAIYQTALYSNVTGARQYPDDSEAAKTADRPKSKTTKEERPFSAVFSGSTDDSAIVFEKKTIIYQYPDDPTWTSYLPAGSGAQAFAYDINDTSKSGISATDKPSDSNTPVQTITVKQQCRGYLLPSAGTDSSLVEAEVLVESSLRKLTLKPRAVVLGTGEDLSLMLDKRESLTSDPIPLNAEITTPATDADGNAQKYESRPTLESQQPIALTPLKTESQFGYAKISALEWTTIYPSQSITTDFGFMPTNTRAAQLAELIATREAQRRDRVLVDMPIPDEWLAAGWSLLNRCQCGHNIYLMDGLAIEIADGMAKFGFNGDLVSVGTETATTTIVNGLPVTTTIVEQRSLWQVDIDLDAQIVYEADIFDSIADAIESQIVYEFEVGSGVIVALNPEIVYEAEIFATPAIVVDAGIVYEADVSTQIYQSIDLSAEIVYEAEITVAIIQTVNFSINPGSVPEGSPILQTVNFSINPGSVPEG
jgi:hypothetical protein